jgi:GntP family gluconate:H+ symporter
MNASLLHVLLCLAAGISLIVLLTVRYRVHAFFALFLACFAVGLGVRLPVLDIIAAARDGFGNVMKSLGLIIVLGTTLGVILEHTGSTKVMASFILKRVGDRRAALAMNLAGFVVGLPIFCDSGYIVLSGLNRSLARRTGIPIAAMAISLGAGLYSVHCLIPPHPGATAAAGIVGVDFGKLIAFGIIVAVPASLAGYLWANFAGRKTPPPALVETLQAEPASSVPSTGTAFLPVIVPVALIALKSFLSLGASGTGGWRTVFLALGDPVVALAIGVLFAFNCGRSWTKNTVGPLLQEAVEKAGGILVIIGAGGAFGAVLTATKIGEQFSSSPSLSRLGILFPFLVAVILKTAQGSSTVAILTAASIVQPLLPALGLATDKGRLLCVLSLGAGSMMLSHANDAYFWVIARFSGLDLKTMLKVHSTASLLMGFVSFLVVWLLSLMLS